MSIANRIKEAHADLILDEQDTKRYLSEADHRSKEIIRQAFLNQKKTGFKSQKSLGRAMGCTQSAVGFYLSGERRIGTDAGLKLCRLLDLDPNEVNPNWLNGAVPHFEDNPLKDFILSLDATKDLPASVLQILQDMARQ